MWLALCEPYDRAGLWAIVGVRRLGLPVEVVLPVELVKDSTLTHRVGTAGADVELRTARGLVLRAPEIDGVFNRLLEIPEAALGDLGGSDRGYVAEELEAALVSCLASLPCPVLNRPTPAGLGGPWRAPAQWRFLAARVGLPAVPWRLSSWDEPAQEEWEERRTALVIGAEVVGAPADELAEGCLEFARAAGTDLLGIDFVRGTRFGWGVETATPIPDLRHGGMPALEALRRALTMAAA